MSATVTGLHRSSGVVCGECGATMRAQEGRRIDTPGATWVWWLCENGHVTAAIPRPPSDSRAIFTDRPTI